MLCVGMLLNPKDAPPSPQQTHTHTHTHTHTRFQSILWLESMCVGFYSFDVMPNLGIYVSPSLLFIGIKIKIYLNQ